jgi:hypothetical protein
VQTLPVQSRAGISQYHVGELEREKDHADGKNDNP